MNKKMKLYEVIFCHQDTASEKASACVLASNKNEALETIEQKMDWIYPKCYAVSRVVELDSSRPRILTFDRMYDENEEDW